MPSKHNQALDSESVSIHSHEDISSRFDSHETTCWVTVCGSNDWDVSDRRKYKFATVYLNTDTVTPETAADLAEMAKGFRRLANLALKAVAARKV